MFCVVTKTMVFCKAKSIKDVMACVRKVVDNHYCFQRAAGKDDFADGPENSEWVWNLTHYTGVNFAIELNVHFWELDDMDAIRGAFRACPQDANFAIEFQRLGGDGFAWLDLWCDLLAETMACSHGSMQFTTNSTPIKRRRLDMDLLSDSDDDADDCDDGDDNGLHNDLVMLMDMSNRSGLNGQLEGLKTFCRMCEHPVQCSQMASDMQFLRFVVHSLYEIVEYCHKSIRGTPLLECVLTLLRYLVNAPGKHLVLTTDLMLQIAHILGDATNGAAAQHECALLVQSMVSNDVRFDVPDTVLNAVSVAVSTALVVPNANGNRLNQLLVEVQSKVLAKMASDVYHVSNR